MSAFDITVKIPLVFINFSALHNRTFKLVVIYMTLHIQGQKLSREKGLAREGIEPRTVLIIQGIQLCCSSCVCFSS